MLLAKEALETQVRQLEATIASLSEENSSLVKENAVLVEEKANHIAEVRQSVSSLTAEWFFCSCLLSVYTLWFAWAKG